jgi:hypothetical protein
LRERELEVGPAAGLDPPELVPDGDQGRGVQHEERGLGKPLDLAADRGRVPLQ